MAGVWQGPGQLLGPSRVTVDPRGRILGMEAAGGRLAQPVILIPALVDAHVHLQLSAAGGPGLEFGDWLAEVVQRRHQEPAAVPAATTRRNLAALRREGTHAVGEIDSLGSSPALLAEAGSAGRCYRELVGIDADARRAQQLLAAGRTRGSLRCPGGWSPHAPYSVSLPLLQAAAASGAPLQVHLAESDAELRYLREGTGPCRELLDRLGKQPLVREPFGGSPLEWLAAGDALQRRTTLVHCQHLAEGDAERIRAAGAAIVVCPGTIEWFDRKPPPVSRWLALGIPVALGTDSQASNRGLSMRREMALARRLWPELAPGVILHMATANGATALRRPSLGRLRIGAMAAWLRVPWPERGSAHDLEERFTAGELPVLDRGPGPGPGRSVEPQTEAT